MTQDAHEQPDPVANDEIPTWGLVIRDLVTNGDKLVAEDAHAHGDNMKKFFGFALVPGNGEDSLYDAYDAGLDLLAYLKNCRVERERGLIRYPLSDVLYQAAYALCVRIRDQLYLRDGK